MPKASPILTNFTAGELSPRLDARVDFSKYYNGCAVLENMMVWPQGGATRRPGTRYVADVKDHDKKVRLVPFEFSTEQAYAIEFGDRYARFYMNKGQIKKPMNNPGTTPTGIGRGAAFSPDGSLLAITHSTSPYVTIYNTSDWSKVTDPGTLPTGTGCGAAFSPDGSLLAIAHTTSPFVTIYNTSDWSKVTDPGTLPAGDGQGAAFSPDGSLLAIAHVSSPYVTIYNTSDWSKMADPGTLPTSIAWDAVFSPDGSLLAIAHLTSPYVTIYNTSDWSKVTDPGTLPAGTGWGAAFSPDGSLLAIAHSMSPYVTIYNTSDWSKVANPGTLPTSIAWDAVFSPDGSLLAITHSMSPYVTIYNTSDWSKVTDPGTLPAGVGYGAAYSPDGSLLAIAHYTSPYMTIYGAGNIYEIPTPYKEGDLPQLQFAQSADVMWITHPSYKTRKLSRTGHTAWLLTRYLPTSDPFIVSWDKLTDPGTLPAGIGRGAAFSPDGSLLAIAHLISPYVTIYNTSDWSKVANPGTLPTGNGYGAAFSPDGSLLAIAHDVSPFVTIYNTSDWSKVTDPGTLPTSTGIGAAFSPDGSLLAIAHDVSPFVTIYNISDWSKVTDPGTLPTGDGVGAAFSPDGSLLAIAHTTSPYVTIYNTSDWSKVTNPGTTPTGNGYGAAFSPDGSLLAIAHLTSPYVTIYNTSDWSKVTDPGTLPAGNGYGAAFSPDGSLLAIAHITSPYVTIYNTSDWSKVADPGTLPAGDGIDAAFSPDGSLLAIAHSTSPSVTIYRESGDDFPRCLGFYEERLWFASTRNNPQTKYSTKSGDFEDITTGTNDDDAVQYTIAADQVNAIQWLAPGPLLLAGTTGGEWKTGSSVLTEPITPTNIKVTRETIHGSAWIQPTMVSHAVLFVQKAKRKVRELGYRYEVDRYTAPDLTLLAEHITRGGITGRMAYQQEPNSIVWAVRSDGVLLGLTYQKDQDVVAWHRHITDGAVESVACIPSLGRDELWLSVKRTIGGVTKRYIEYMNAEEVDALEDMFFVDSGLSYSGPPATTISGLDHLKGKTVSILADGIVVADQVVSGTGTITLVTAASKVHVGLPYTSKLQTMRIEAGSAEGTAQGKIKKIRKVAVRLLESSGFRIGPNEDRLDTADVSAGLFTGDKEILFKGGWETEGKIMIVQEQPLPLTVLAIIARLRTSD